MLAYMLDTNICINVVKGRSNVLLNRFNARADELCISTITLAELYFGAEQSARPAMNLAGIESFVARLDVLPFGPKAALHYGSIQSDLKTAGTPVGINDMLIGAHARSEGLVVVTNNRREFDRIDGLRVEDWL